MATKKRHQKTEKTSAGNLAAYGRGVTLRDAEQSFCILAKNPKDTERESAANLFVLLMGRVHGTTRTFSWSDCVKTWRLHAEDRISLETLRELFDKYTAALVQLGKLEAVTGIDETIYLLLN